MMMLFKFKPMEKVNGGQSLNLFVNWNQSTIVTEADEDTSSKPWLPGSDAWDHQQLEPMHFQQ